MGRATDALANPANWRPLHAGWNAGQIIAHLERKEMRARPDGSRSGIPLIHAAVRKSLKGMHAGWENGLPGFNPKHPGRWYLYPDCYAEALERILRRAHSYDGARAAPTTWLWDQAEFAVKDFLTMESRHWHDARLTTPGPSEASPDREHPSVIAHQLWEWWTPGGPTITGWLADWYAAGWAWDDLLPGLVSERHAARVLEAATRLSRGEQRITTAELARATGLTYHKARGVMERLPRLSQRYGVAFLLASGETVGEQGRAIAAREGIPIPAPQEQAARARAFLSLTSSRENFVEAVERLARSGAPIRALPWP